MAISTNGAIITRLAGALYGEYLSNASYVEVSTTAPATVAANWLTNDFAGKTDMQVATTILKNLGLTSITGLDNWLSAQLTAAGSTAVAKGAALVSILNGYANMTTDATYSSYAVGFNTKVDASLALSQTAGAKGGSFATADVVAVTNGSFTLTTSVDNVAGTSGNDTFSGTQETTGSTFNTGDVLNGGAGTDSLSLINTAGAAANTATVSGIENVTYRSTAAGGTLDMDNFSGVTTLTLDRTVGANDVSNVALTTGVTFANSNATMDTTVTYKATAVTGTADSATVTLNGVAAGADIELAGDVETITINTTGAASSLADLVLDAQTTTLNIAADEALTVATTFTAAGVTSLSASGDSLVTITPALNAATTTVSSASQTAGGLAVTLGAAATVTVTGGAGNDSFNIDAVTGVASITAGAGNDTITAATNLASTDVINGGDGTDTLTTAVDLVDAAAVATAWTNLTSVETLNLTTITDEANTINVANLSSAMNRVNISAITGTTDNTQTINFAAGAATVGLNIAAAITAGDTLAVDAAGSGTSDALTITNMLTTGNMGTTTSGITVTDYETVAINTGSYTTASVQDLGAINAGTAAVSVSGSNGLTIAAGFVGGSLDASGLTGGGAVALIMSGAATTVSSITGSAGNDTIVGDASGNLSGAAGNDNITGGTGNDTVSGGAGNDTIAGGTGSNTITGDDGADSITASTGADTIDGGAGNDIVIISGAQVAADDSLVGGADTDILEINTAEITSVLGGQKVSGFEVFSAATTGLTQDMAYFANNAFTAVRANGVAALTVTNAGADLNTFRVGASNTTLSFDRATDNTTNALTILATANANISTSFTAADEETITIDSNDGTVTIADLAASDLTTLVATGDNNVAISASTGATAVTTVTNSLTGAATFSATVANATGAVTFTAGSSTGTSTITTGAGNDVVTAGTGALSATTGAGSDSITGGAGNDTIVSGNSADTVSGGAGVDDITGGNGADNLTGGAGADIFQYDAVAEGGDTITDFTSASDTLDVDGILNGLTKVYEEIANDAADITTDANVIVVGGSTDIATAAALIAADATVTGTAGLIVISNGTSTSVYHTTNLGTDGTETLLVTLTGIANATSLVTADFVFA